MPDSAHKGHMHKELCLAEGLSICTPGVNSFILADLISNCKITLSLLQIFYLFRIRHYFLPRMNIQCIKFKHILKFKLPSNSYFLGHSFPDAVSLIPELSLLDKGRGLN